MVSVIKKDQGFTLIELLVVIVLLGLLTGVAVSTIGGGNQARELDLETNRLHALLRAASNEAVFTNTEIGVYLTEQGYGFLQYSEEEQEWADASTDLLKSYSFPEWIDIEFQREGERIELPGSEEESNSVTEAEQAKPDFMLLSSGEITGFTIRLSLSEDQDTFREITLNEFGEIILPHVEGDS